MKRNLCINKYHLSAINLFLVLVFNTTIGQGQDVRDSFLLDQRGQGFYEQVDDSNTPDENSQLLIKAIACFEKTGNGKKLLECYNDLTQVYYYKEAFDSFFYAADQAEKIALSYSLTQLDIYSITLSNLGTKNYTLGNMNLASKYFQKAIELEPEDTQSKGDMAAYYQNFGFIRHSQGDYEQSLIYLNQAKNLFMDSLGPINKFLPAVYLDIAKNYKFSNQYEKAIESLKTSLNILSNLKTNSDYLAQNEWDCYQNLSDIYLALQFPSPAKEYALKAIQIQETNKNYTIAADYKSYLSLGEAYRFEKNYTKALELFQQAEKAALKERVGTGPNIGLSEVYSFLTNIYFDQSKFPKALEASHKAINAFISGSSLKHWSENPKEEQFPIGREAVDLLFKKALILQKIYQKKLGELATLEQAYNTYCLVTSMIKLTRQELLENGSKNKFATSVIPIYEKGIETALQLYELTDQEIFLKQAFQFSESNKANLLLEAINENIAKGFGNIPTDLLEQEQKIRSEIAFYEKKISEEILKETGQKDVGKIENFKNRLFDLKKNFNAQIRQLELNYPKYIELKYPQPFDFIQKTREELLDEQTALIEFFVGLENVYLFGITQNDLIVEKTNQIEALKIATTNLINVISTAPNSETYERGIEVFSESSSFLFSQLLSKVVTQFPKAVDQLILIPDDFLSYLPFELLKLDTQAFNDFRSQNFRFLLEQYAFSYNYSTNLLLSSKKNRANQNGKFIGFAPKFGGNIASERAACLTSSLSSLLCNEEEVNKIESIFEGSKIIGKEAKKEKFLTEVEDFEIIHLATHACVNHADPRSSQIFFEDGYLTEYDLTNLKLNANLVVLSACNTGVGQLVKGEGVLSLSRGFMLAGSASMLTSLWAVDDCNTSNIMIQYYDNLKKGMSKNKALRGAKLKHIERADKETSHPYYWAPFIQYGDIEPLVQSENNWMPYILGLVLLGLIFFLKRRF